MNPNSNDVQTLRGQVLHLQTQLLFERYLYNQSQQKFLDIKKACTTNRQLKSRITELVRIASKPFLSFIERKYQRTRRSPETVDIATTEAPSRDLNLEKVKVIMNPSNWTGRNHNAKPISRKLQTYSHKERQIWREDVQASLSSLLHTKRI